VVPAVAVRVVPAASPEGFGAVLKLSGRRQRGGTDPEHRYFSSPKRGPCRPRFLHADEPLPKKIKDL